MKDEEKKNYVHVHSSFYIDTFFLPSFHSHSISIDNMVQGEDNRHKILHSFELSPHLTHNSNFGSDGSKPFWALPLLEQKEALRPAIPVQWSRIGTDVDRSWPWHCPLYPGICTMRAQGWRHMLPRGCRVGKQNDPPSEELCIRCILGINWVIRDNVVVSIYLE